MRKILYFFNFIFKEILLEISFIEEMRTTSGNRGASNLFSQLLLYAKIDLIHLILYHWQPCILQFYNIT